MTYKRVDDNQTRIVKDLREAGMTVQHLHNVHGGCPDIVVGYKGKNYMFEIKRDKVAKLTPDQVIWHHNWQGQVNIIITSEEAINAIKQEAKKAEKVSTKDASTNDQA